jgi:hypothetical protein
MTERVRRNPLSHRGGHSAEPGRPSYVRDDPAPPVALHHPLPVKQSAYRRS